MPDHDLPGLPGLVVIAHTCLYVFPEDSVPPATDDPSAGKALVAPERDMPLLAPGEKPGVITDEP